MIAVLIPTTCPWAFRSGPPEFPGLIAASVCIKSILLLPSPISELFLPTALIIPAVTVLSKPNGLPMAIAHSPGCSLSEVTYFDRWQVFGIYFYDRYIGYFISP